MIPSRDTARRWSLTASPGRRPPPPARTGPRNLRSIVPATETAWSWTARWTDTRSASICAASITRNSCSLAAGSIGSRNGRSIDRRAEQQAVLGRDLGRDRLRPHAIATRAQADRAHRIDRERGIEPALEAAAVARLQIMAARKDRDTCARQRRTLEHDVSQSPAGVAGDDN